MGKDSKNSPTEAETEKVEKPPKPESSAKTVPLITKSGKRIDAHPDEVETLRKQGCQPAPSKG